MWQPDGLMHGSLLVATGLALVTLAPTLRHHPLPSRLHFIAEWKPFRERGQGWWLEALYLVTGLFLAFQPLRWCIRLENGEPFMHTLQIVTSLVWILCIWFAHRAGRMRWKTPDGQGRVYFIRLVIWAVGAFLLTQLLKLNYLAQGLIPPL